MIYSKTSISVVLMSAILGSACGAPETPGAIDADVEPMPTAETGVAWVEERFVASPPKSDILFVVDNSRSMAPYQLALATDIGQVVEALDDAGVDWRAAVTSTDIDMESCGFRIDEPLNGRLQPGDDGSLFVSSLSFDPVAQLGARLQLGEGGSGCEKGLGAAYRAIELRGGGLNADFYREEASLHIVVLSDEQDQTEDDNPPLVTLREFSLWMSELPKPRSTFSSVVCFEAAADCPDVGSRYMRVTEDMSTVPHGGGGVFDLAADMADTVAGLADILDDATVVYPLAQAADPDGLEVRIDGALASPPLYEYEALSNTLIFRSALPDGAQITVRYRPL